MTGDHFIYLASQSPRRRELLERIGVHYELLVADNDEDAEALEAVNPGEAAAHYVQRVTRLKLEAAVRRRERRGLKPAPILCADTTVTLNRKILGKPLDDADAHRMLKLLQGRTHRVLTAVALALPQAQGSHQVLAQLSESRVRIANMSDHQIQSYVASGEPRGKAGAYGIQGRMAVYVSHLSGSYTGVVGLPLYETALLLNEGGLHVWAERSA